jgi:hypothetical protein
MDHVHSVIDLVTSPSADVQFTKEELRGWQSKGVVDVDFALDISVRKIFPGARRIAHISVPIENLRGLYIRTRKRSDLQFRSFRPQRRQ